MATALYSTLLTHPDKVRQVQAYLYADTELISTQMVHKGEGQGELCYLVLRTECETAFATEQAQQTQADRLASGLFGLTIGFETRRAAQAHVHARAALNVGWALGLVGVIR